MRILLFILAFSLATTSQAVEGTWLIEAYGDSTTVGSFNDNGVMKLDYVAAEPSQIQNVLRDDYGISAWVPNQGVGGTQATQLLYGEDGLHKPWFETMRTSKAQIVLLNFGYNDKRLFLAPEDGNIKESPERFKETLIALVVIAQNLGKIAVLQEPNPNCHSRPWEQQDITGYVDAIRQAAKATDAPLVEQYDALQLVPGWRKMLSDCVHPKGVLYHLKAVNTARVLAKIINDLGRQKIATH